MITKTSFYTLAAALASCAGGFAPQALAETPHIMIVTSDPQYPWTAATDAGETDGDVDPALAEALVREQYESIAAFRRAHPSQDIPVIINGDITAHGQFWEHQKMNALFSILGDNYYYGLGNHDYQNNLRNDIPCALLGCAMESLDNLAHHVVGHQRKHRILDFDQRSYARGATIVKEGSRAYAFVADGWKNVIQMQLNNSPTYKADIQWGALTKAYHYKVTPSGDWLQKKLPEYDRPDVADFILVHAHKPSGWTFGSSPELVQTLANHRIAAVFAGHLHASMGEYLATRHWGNVPVFVSGSASQRTYLIVEHWREAKKLRVYGVENNNPDQRELIREIDV